MAWQECSECGRCPAMISDREHCRRIYEEGIDELILEWERLDSYLKSMGYMIDENDIQFYLQRN